MRGAALFALITILIAFGGFGGWAAFAAIESAALATGAIKVESHRKTVQQIDGGVIKRLLVREGDAVQAGSVLLELDDTQARTALAIIRLQHRLALARQARLQAELAERETVAFSDQLLDEASDPEIAAILANQSELFNARRKAHAGQVKILEGHVSELRHEIAAREAAAKSAAQQLRYIEEEIRGVKELFDKGLERKPRLLALQRAAAELRGHREEELANIARARQAIAGIELQMVDLANHRRTEINDAIEATQKDLADLAERLVDAENVLKRMTVVAPQEGVVVDLRVFTPGGVIRPGDPILDIVPRNDDLIVEVRVNPADIDSVRPGLPAHVRLLAYKPRRVPTVPGRVETVSADLLNDPRTNEFYYAAQIRLDATELAALSDVDLYPGMPVEAQIVTGERTPLDYLLSPVTDGLHRAFREE